MKRIQLLLLALALFGAACKDKTATATEEKQTTENKTVNPQAEHDLKLYRYSINIADPYTAISALSSYLMRDTNANIAYKDTLLQLYVETRSLMAAYKLSEEILKKKPNDTTTLEINLESAKSIGQLGASLDRAKQLTDMAPANAEYKFFYARALFENGHLKEAEKILLEVANDPQYKNQTTSFIWYKNGQPFPMEAKIQTSALMQIGQYYANARDKKTAKSYFRKIRSIDPQFQPAAEAILELDNLPF